MTSIPFCGGTNNPAIHIREKQLRYKITSCPQRDSQGRDPNLTGETVLGYKIRAYCAYCLRSSLAFAGLQLQSLNNTQYNQEMWFLFIFSSRYLATMSASEKVLRVMSVSVFLFFFQFASNWDVRRLIWTRCTRALTVLMKISRVSGCWGGEWMMSIWCGLIAWQHLRLKSIWIMMDCSNATQEQITLFYRVTSM